MSENKELESKSLNIYEKLQKSRSELAKMDIKKTGYNKHSLYYYFELSDFLPHIVEVCNSNRLCTQYEFSSQSASLTVIDIDNIESKLIFNTPVEIVSLMKCSGMQNIGATQTFSKKYLYMTAFEIAETDIVDNGEVDQDSINAKKKISPTHVFTIKKLIDDTGTDLSKFLGYAGVSKVEDITNEAVSNCISMLNKKVKQLEVAKEEQEKLQKDLENKTEDFDF